MYSVHVMGYLAHYSRKYCMPTFEELFTCPEVMGLDEYLAVISDRLDELLTLPLERSGE